MTIDGRHRIITRANNHGIVSPLGPYVDATARRLEALTSAQEGLVAQQLSDHTYWMVGYNGTGYSWQPLTSGPEVTFTGDFGALFTGYSGLTVRAYWRGDLGTSGTQGTGKAAWANQLGDGSDMGFGSATNGIGSLGTLNGKAVVVTDGSTQWGLHTFPTGATAPATKNRHTYRVQALTAAGTGYVLAGSGGMYVVKGGATADQQIGNGSGGATSSGEALSTWHRLRASWIGGLDVVRVGSHQPTPVSTSNNGPGTNWGFAANSAGASPVALMSALIVEVEGPLTTFNTAAADADAKLATFWAGATAIEI